ncbi:MAG: InlB B-repeat-containing protein [Bacilli bacterium]|nr:InlB B-repeat-containing protein [Bacilli bacterium]
MNKKKIMTFASLLSSMFLVTACGGKEGPKESQSQDVNTSIKEESSKVEAGDKEVASIAMKNLPTKTSYYVDEEFSPEGGTIEITYGDGTTDEKSITDPEVECSIPNTSRAGTKTITVKYAGKKCTFKIDVKVRGTSITFDLNYEGAPAGIVQDVPSGYSATEPNVPTRDGYTFYKWYRDKDCTVEYDMETPVKADITVYAMWKENGKDYFTFSYEFNYYGVSISSYEQIVQKGEKARTLAVPMTRVDYRFVEWCTSSDCSSSFSLDNPISSNTKAYAKWAKAKEGVTTYKFEAEDVDLSQKAGPGYSGENAGVGMVVTKQDIGASQDKFVAYQCKNGNSLEFNVAADENLNDVNVYVRLATEFASISVNPDDYRISVNGTPLDYSEIKITLPEGKDQSNFTDYKVGMNVTLNKGANVIQLKTTNNKELGGTLTATAPIIDCIKLETAGVVIWDGVLGLPAANY